MRRKSHPNPRQRAPAGSDRECARHRCQQPLTISHIGASSPSSFQVNKQGLLLVCEPRLLQRVSRSTILEDAPGVLQGQGKEAT